MIRSCHTTCGRLPQSRGSSRHFLQKRSRWSTKPGPLSRHFRQYQGSRQQSQAHGSAASSPAGDSTSDPSDLKRGGGLRQALRRVRNWVFGGPLDKAKLQSLGLGAFVSYGFVSNVTYGVVVAIGWASHVSATGLTPFAPNQWQGFLARVAGLLALQQLLRPIRFSCAVALTPLVDRMMDSLQRRLGITKRKAFFLMLGLLAIVTTTGYAAALTTVTVLNMPKTAV